MEWFSAVVGYCRSMVYNLSLFYIWFHLESYSRIGSLLKNLKVLCSGSIGNPLDGATSVGVPAGLIVIRGDVF